MLQVWATLARQFGATLPLKGTLQFSAAFMSLVSTSNESQIGSSADLPIDLYCPLLKIHFDWGLLAGCLILELIA